MSLLSSAPTLLKLRTSVASDRYSFLENSYLAVTGKVPADIEANADRVTDVPAGITPIAIEGKALLPRVVPVVEAPARLSHAALLKKFSWTEADLKVAEGCGLPAPVSRRIEVVGFQAPRLIGYWDEADLDQWAGRIRALRIT